MAVARKIRLGETVIYCDGTKREAALVTLIVEGSCVHLKALPPRGTVRDEMHVPHRKDAPQSDDRYWIRIDEDRA